MRSALHGGLTPPALGRECERWANYAYSSWKFDRNIAASRSAPSTHAYSICRLDTFTTAGARHPLLVASADAVANVRFWPTKKMLFHGGLTPPALVADTTSVRRKNDDFCDEQTHVYKSGGREPAVGRETRLRRYECDCSENRRQYVGRSPLPSRAAIPRGAYAPRS